MKGNPTDPTSKSAALNPDDTRPRVDFDKLIENKKDLSSQQNDMGMEYALTPLDLEISMAYMMD